jgi:hypothetical protein
MLSADKFKYYFIFIQMEFSVLLSLLFLCLLFFNYYLSCG